MTTQAVAHTCNCVEEQVFAQGKARVVFRCPVHQPTANELLPELVKALKYAGAFLSDGTTRSIQAIDDPYAEMMCKPPRTMTKDEVISRINAAISKAERGSNK